MTPTEQDNELREAILLEFKNVYRLAPADYTENCTNVVMHLIPADRKRVALGKEEMAFRYAIQTLQDTSKEFALENLLRQLDKNLAQQEEV